MKNIVAILLLMTALSGCYTQFEVVERPLPPRTYVSSLDFYGYPGMYQHYWITPYMRPQPPTYKVIIIKKEPRVETVKRNTERTPTKETNRRSSGVVRKSN
jgi:hypothetical protein